MCAIAATFVSVTRCRRLLTHLEACSRRLPLLIITTTSSSCSSRSRTCNETRHVHSSGRSANATLTRHSSDLPLLLALFSGPWRPGRVRPGCPRPPTSRSLAPSVEHPSRPPARRSTAQRRHRLRRHAACSIAVHVSRAAPRNGKN